VLSMWFEFGWEFGAVTRKTDGQVEDREHGESEIREE
jgi:hypothetical protein